MRHFSFRPSLQLRGRRFKGLRGFAGKPLHPPLTDIPIAAYLFTAAFDVLSVTLHTSHPAVARQLYLSGTWILLTGATISVAAALTGWADWHSSSQPGTQARRTINAHAVTMLAVTAIVLVNLVLRCAPWVDRSWAPVIVVGLSVLSALLAVIGATLGGTLVFDYGFNVETAGDHPVWHRSEVDVVPGDRPAS